MATRRNRKWTEGSILVREATVEDAKIITPDLRMEDRAELVASTGLMVPDALLSNYANSSETYVGITESGTRIFIGGVSPDPDGRQSHVTCAQLWLFCTPLAGRAPITLIHLLRQYIDILGQKYGILYGYVDARNTVRQRWLRALGLHVNTDQTVRSGHLKLPFHVFSSSVEAAANIAEVETI